MSTCVERMPCLDCGSSDSIQVYLNIDRELDIRWYTAFCHGKCWDRKPDPYGDGKEAPKVHVKTPEEIRDEIKTILTCKPFKPKLSYRGIPRRHFGSWGVRTILSEYDRSTYGIAFPMPRDGRLAGWKCCAFRRKLDGSKAIFGVGRTNDVDPFGFERALKIGGDTLYVTEGEYDAIALDYCLTLAGSDEVYPVISLTHGGGSLMLNMGRIISRIADAGFKRVCFVLDDDDVGHLAEEAAMELEMSLSVSVITKPNGTKDANQALVDGYGLEMGQLALAV